MSRTCEALLRFTSSRTNVVSFSWLATMEEYLFKKAKPGRVTLLRYEQPCLSGLNELFCPVYSATAAFQT